MNAGHFWDLKGFVEFRGDVFSIGKRIDFFSSALVKYFYHRRWQSKGQDYSQLSKGNCETSRSVNFWHFYFQNYNPNIVGASVGDSLPLDAIQWQNHIIQPFDPEITHLNGAQSMARIDHVPSQIE